MDNRELWLATTLVELADTSDTDFDEALYRHRLAACLGQLLAPAEIDVLSADSGGRLPGVAATTGPVTSLPVRRHDSTVGVIRITAADGQRLGEAELSLAQLLAEAAAVAILQQRALTQSARTAEHLQRALDSRVLIEQAKGVLAARLDVTPETAFVLLRNFARGHNRPLDDVAGEAVRGELRPWELLASAPAPHRRAHSRAEPQP